MPSALLAALHTYPHPTTGDPWLLPVSLATDKKQLGAPLRFLGRQLIVQQLGKKKAWEKIYEKGPRLTDRSSSSNHRKPIWREDMPDLVLSLLRQRVVDRLSWNFSFRGRLIPVVSPHSSHLSAIDDVSTVLVFSSLRTRADDLQDRCDAITAELEQWAAYFGQNFGNHFDPHQKPGVTHRAPAWYTAPLVPHLQPRVQFPELEFRTTVWRGTKVAVYSLTDLLGKEKASELIEGEGSKYADQKCVVIKRARHNVPVEILLMQLQAYMARPGI